MAQSTCSIEDCGKQHLARTWCAMHYRRWRITGSTDAPTPRVRSICGEPGCEGIVNSGGLCCTHVAQMRRWGEIRPLTRTERRVVDGRRECRLCAEWLPVARFGPDLRSKYGIKTTCRDCAHAEAVAWRERRPDYYIEWGRANQDRRAAANQKRRAARLERESETISRLEVFQRDEYWCGICDGPIDASAKWPDPMSASLDHVVPLNRGGTHTYDNVQASHFACNCRKGDRVGDELAALFA